MNDEQGQNLDRVRLHAALTCAILDRIERLIRNGGLSAGKPPNAVARPKAQRYPPPLVARVMWTPLAPSPGWHRLDVARQVGSFATVRVH
jgi:hypothetical protein